MVNSRQVRSLTDFPPEIMEYIFEQLGPENSSHQDVDLCTETLRSSLFVSRYYRAFALPRLFQSIRVHVQNKGSESSLPRLDLLLSILCPSSLHVQWMSILPFVRNFELTLWCPYDTDSEPYLPRLLSILSGDQSHQLKSLDLSLQACRSLDCRHFTKAFQDAVVHLLKMPKVQSVKIAGAGFLSLDFLRSTHIRQLDVLSYDPQAYPYSRSPDEEKRGNSRLRSLSTDSSFPFRVETPEAESLLEGLDHLSIDINDNCEHIYAKVANILRFTTTLKTLTPSYGEHYGYPPAQLEDWHTNFGEMQALETLEMWFCSFCTDEDVEGVIVSAGEDALYLLFAALDTIRVPMPRLTRLRWQYSFCMANPTKIPFLPFEDWLRQSPRWGTLDRTLTSDIFPVLSAVQLKFDILGLGLDEDSINQIPGVTTRMQQLRKEVFSRSVAAFGEKFELELEN